MEDLIPLLVGILPPILALFAGYIIVNATAGYLAWKDVVSQLRALSGAIHNAFVCLDDALDDDEVTPEEIDDLIDQLALVTAEFRILIDRIANTGLPSMIRGLLFGIFRRDYRNAVTARIPTSIRR